MAQRGSANHRRKSHHSQSVWGEGGLRSTMLCALMLHVDFVVCWACTPHTFALCHHVVIARGCVHLFSCVIRKADTQWLLYVSPVLLLFSFTTSSWQHQYSPSHVAACHMRDNFFIFVFVFLRLLPLKSGETIIFEHCGSCVSCLKCMNKLMQSGTKCKKCVYLCFHSVTCVLFGKTVMLIQPSALSPAVDVRWDQSEQGTSVWEEPKKRTSTNMRPARSSSPLPCNLRLKKTNISVKMSDRKIDNRQKYIRCQRCFFYIKKKTVIMDDVFLCGALPIPRQLNPAND